MTVTDEAQAYLKSTYGVRVTRATATLPGTATGALFTVTGGLVLVTSIVGVVTTSIQAQANAVKLVATPTTGSVNDLTATVDVNGLAAGGILTPVYSSGATSVFNKSTGGGIPVDSGAFVVAPGAIGINTAATNTGSVRWVLTYVPLESGAAVVAA